MASSQWNVYGGDEISAIVVDPGSYYTKFGFAGEDAPKVVLSSDIARKENPDYDPEQLPTEGEESTNGSASSKYKYFFDDSVHYPRKDTEVFNPMVDGVVEDWESTIALWDYGLQNRLNVDTTEHPLLITEQTWNSDENRAKAMEYAFEHYNSPAFYIVKTPVCALLTSNKGGSGLVVDVGHRVATVTPVIDGLVLYKPSRRTRVAGAFLSAQIEKLLAEKEITLNPRYIIAGKKPVAENASADFTKRDFDFDLHENYIANERESVLHEFKESMVQVENLDAKENETTISDRAMEFPDGYNTTFGKDRYDVAEAWFKPKENVVEGWTAEDDAEPETTEEKDPLLVTDRSTTGFKYNGITDLIVESINACDVDIRPNLANNIVITGGATLVQGFNDRINHELTKELAGLKVRLYSPGNTVERRNASWIGGSILASLGTFHQLWISKKEYEEVGPQKLLEKRFR